MEKTPLVIPMTSLDHPVETVMKQPAVCKCGRPATVQAYREIGFGYTVTVADLCRRCARKWGMK